MELYVRQYPEIDDAGYSLPQDLLKANISEFSASPLGDHHHRLPVTQRREFYSPEGRWNGGNNLLPFSWVEVFLPRCHAKPHPEVFSAHAGCSSGTM